MLDEPSKIYFEICCKNGMFGQFMSPEPDPKDKKKEEEPSGVDKSHIYI